MKNLKPLRTWLVSALAILASTPLFAVPLQFVNVTDTKIASTLNGDFIYQPMAADSQNLAPKARLAIDIFLTNNESFAVTVDRVVLGFDSPFSTMTLDSALRMWCNNVLMKRDFGDTLIMPANTACRLGLLPDPQLSLPAPGRLGIEVYFKKGTENVVNPLILPERDLVAYANTTVWGSFRFPAKAEDLDPGTFWSGRSSSASHNHRFGGDPTEIYAYDMGIARLDTSGPTPEWKPTYALDPGETSANDENEDYLVWGKPIYAMADGIVSSCIDSFLDDTPTVDNGDFPNVIAIKHGGLDITRYSHLKQGSATALGVCVVNTPILAGQQIGLVGNSGQSSAPHLHIEVRRDNEPMPLLFNEAFIVDRSDTVFANAPYGNAPWAEMDGHGFSFTETVLWPSGLRRRGDATDVGITATSLVHTSTTRSMTASRTTAGNLRVSLWNTDSAGDAVLLDTDTSGGVSKVSLAVPNSTTDAALAMITAGGTLKIAAYDVNGNTITRTTDFAVNPATDVATAQANFSRGIVTAVLTQSNGLKVIAWTVDPANASIVRKGDDSGIGNFQQGMQVVRTFSFPGVVTAARTGSSHLRLSTFKLASSGSVVTHIDDADDSLAARVSLARLGTRSNGEDLVVTAIRTITGHLQLVSWSIDSSGNITRLNDVQGDDIGEVSSARATNNHLLTAVKNDSGNLELIAWHVADDGTFTKRTVSSAGAATQIRQEGARASSSTQPQMTVTALADSSGTLKLIVHEVLLHD